MDDLIPLHLLAAGQLAQVEFVAGAADHVHRLHELGLCHGTQIEMIRAGVPCIIRLGENKLCLRGDELTTVLVRRNGT